MTQNSNGKQGNVRLGGRAGRRPAVSTNWKLHVHVCDRSLKSFSMFSAGGARPLAAAERRAFDS